MAVRIRLKKRFNREGYDIIATSNGQLRGRVLERIGFYSTDGLENFVRINLERLNYWLKNGAVCSERVIKITKIYGSNVKGSE